MGLLIYSHSKQFVIIVGPQPIGDSRHVIAITAGSTSTSDMHLRGIRRGDPYATYSESVLVNEVVGRLCSNTFGSQWAYMPEPALEGGVEPVPVTVEDVATDGELCG